MAAHQDLQNGDSRLLTLDHRDNLDELSSFDGGLPKTSAGALASRLILAVDLPTSAEALGLAERVKGQIQWLKVGLELFVAEGHSAMGELSDLGFDIFLDLKLHDIPNTVARAVSRAANSGAKMLTIHAAGGPAMLQAAAAAADQSKLKLLAVTVLSSMDQAELSAVGIAGKPDEQVLRLASLALEANINGLVCSAHEVEALRREFGSEAEGGPVLVVPGIRPAGSSVDDQRRVATPLEALRAGASYLVIGRPITQASDPQAALAAILASLS